MDVAERLVAEPSQQIQLRRIGWPATERHFAGPIVVDSRMVLRYQPC